jgi:hypothetical protein
MRATGQAVNSIYRMACGDVRSTLNWVWMVGHRANLTASYIPLRSAVIILSPLLAESFQSGFL